MQCVDNRPGVEAIQFDGKNAVAVFEFLEKWEIVKWFAVSKYVKPHLRIKARGTYELNRGDYLVRSDIDLIKLTARHTVMSSEQFNNQWEPIQE
jgi:hypothetical protein